MSLLVLVAFLALPGCGGGKNSGGKSFRERKSGAYTEIDKSFQPLRRDFEAEVGKIRLVGVVTPTCGECLTSVEAISSVLLSRVRSEDLEVFLLWAGVAAADVTPRAERVAQQYADPRIKHYWDNSGRIARAFAAQMGLESGHSIYNVFFFYGRNDTWDPQARMAEEPPGQNALLAGWMPAPPRFRMGENMQVKMPAFDINALTKQAEELLAESLEGAPGMGGQEEGGK